MSSSRPLRRTKSRREGGGVPCPLRLLTINVTDTDGRSCRPTSAPVPFDDIPSTCSCLESRSPKCWMESTVNDRKGSRGRWRHDMKNQLGVILGFSDLLLEEMDPGDPRCRDVQEIHAAATRAMELLAKLLLSEGDSTP